MAEMLGFMLHFIALLYKGSIYPDDMIDAITRTRMITSGDHMKKIHEQQILICMLVHRYGEPCLESMNPFPFPFLPQ